MSLLLYEHLISSCHNKSMKLGHQERYCEYCGLTWRPIISILWSMLGLKDIDILNSCLWLVCFTLRNFRCWNLLHDPFAATVHLYTCATHCSKLRSCNTPLTELKTVQPKTLTGDVLLQKLPVVRLSGHVKISHHIWRTTPFLPAVCSEDVQGKWLLIVGTLRLRCSTVGHASV